MSNPWGKRSSGDRVLSEPAKLTKRRNATPSPPMPYEPPDPSDFAIPYQGPESLPDSLYNSISWARSGPVGTQSLNDFFIIPLQNAIDAALATVDSAPISSNAPEKTAAKRKASISKRLASLRHSLLWAYFYIQDQSDVHQSLEPAAIAALSELDFVPVDAPKPEKSLTELAEEILEQLEELGLRQEQCQALKDAIDGMISGLGSAIIKLSSEKEAVRTLRSREVNLTNPFEVAMVAFQEYADAWEKATQERRQLNADSAAGPAVGPAAGPAPLDLTLAKKSK